MHVAVSLVLLARLLEKRKNWLVDKLSTQPDDGHGLDDEWEIKIEHMSVNETKMVAQSINI